MIEDNDKAANNFSQGKFNASGFAKVEHGGQAHARTLGPRTLTHSTHLRALQQKD